MSVVSTIYKNAIEMVFHREADLNSFDGKLYHYTTTDGLLGILRTQMIWGTESAYLNDTNEVDYGLTVSNEVLEEAYNASNSGLEQRIMKSTMKHLSERPEEIYVGCFSEKADLLSQWKGYADFGSGFAIEFDPTQLSRFKRKHPFVNISIQRVIYQREEQRTLVSEQISNTVAESQLLVHKNPCDQILIESAGASTLAYILRHKALFFKNEAFEEEREWRAIYVNDEKHEEGRQPIEFRSCAGIIVPYMPLDLGPSAGMDSWSLPISGIVFGSLVNQNMAEKSISLICKGQDIPIPELKVSKIPLR